MSRIVCTGVPVGCEFGVDCQAWAVGPQFRGIRNLPAGLHLVYFAAAAKGSAGTVHAPRTSFLLNIPSPVPPIALCLRWNAETEDLDADESDGSQRQRYLDDLDGLDRYLGCFQDDNSRHRWATLTTHLSPALAASLEPRCRRITSVTQCQPDVPIHAQPKPSASGLVEQEDARLRFTHVPDRLFPPNASAAERTQHSLDRSYTLESALLSRRDEMDSVGELQFAFICFLLGQVFDAFEQWKRLVHVFCCSELAIDTHPELYCEFIEALHSHLCEIPEDFLLDLIRPANNFLIASLKRLFASLHDGAGSSEVQKKGLRLRKFVMDRFSWDFDEEEDEDLPVIVDS